MIQIRTNAKNKFKGEIIRQNILLHWKLKNFLSRRYSYINSSRILLWHMSKQSSCSNGNYQKMSTCGFPSSLTLCSLTISFTFFAWGLSPSFEEMTINLSCSQFGYEWYHELLLPIGFRILKRYKSYMSISKTLI